MAKSFVRFPGGYANIAPQTIYEADAEGKQLRPISSGEAFTGAGFQFGQERIADPKEFEGYATGAPITRAEELAGIKTDLNALQNNLFTNTEVETNKRRSSQLDAEITKALAESETERAAFNAQRTKYNDLDHVNLFQEYQKLRTEKGIPGIEDQFVDTRKTRRELPYTERASTGNAGVATESQLAAQTAQKDIPLGIQEQNLIDRLNLANDYVKTAVSLKGQDADKSRAALEKAIALTQDGMQAIQTRISNLSGLRTRIQADVDKGIDNKRATIQTLLTTNALGKISDSDLRILEAEAGFPTGSLAGIKKSLKPKDDVITTQTDDNGNVTIVTRDPATNVFSTHTIPGIGNRQNGKKTEGEYKLSSDHKGRLLSAGLTAGDIENIEQDLNRYGIDQVVAGLSSAQAKVVRDVLAGVTPTQVKEEEEKAKDNRQFLTKDYFKNTFTTSQLNDAAKEAGFRGGFLNKKGDTDEYLDHLEKLVGQYREAGYTDQEILKMMQ